MGGICRAAVVAPRTSFPDNKARPNSQNVCTFSSHEARYGTNFGSASTSKPLFGPCGITRNIPVRMERSDDRQTDPGSAIPPPPPVRNEEGVLIRLPLAPPPSAVESPARPRTARSTAPAPSLPSLPSLKPLSPRIPLDFPFDRSSVGRSA